MLHSRINSPRALLFIERSSKQAIIPQDYSNLPSSTNLLDLYDRRVRPINSPYTTPSPIFEFGPVQTTKDTKVIISSASHLRFELGSLKSALRHFLYCTQKLLDAPSAKWFSFTYFHSLIKKPRERKLPQLHLATLSIKTYSVLRARFINLYIVDTSIHLLC